MLSTQIKSCLFLLETDSFCSLTVALHTRICQPTVKIRITSLKHSRRVHLWLCFYVQLLTVAWTGYGETTCLPILHGLSYLPSLLQFALQICRHPHCGRIRPDLKHSFFNLPPLSVFRDIFLRHVDCHRAVRHGGDHLTERLCPHIAHGVNAGNAGLRGLSGHDIAALVQR